MFVYENKTENLNLYKALIIDYSIFTKYAIILAFKTFVICGLVQSCAQMFSMFSQKYSVYMQ